MCPFVLRFFVWYWISRWKEEMMIRLKQSEKIVSQLEAVNTSAGRKLENSSSVVYLKSKYTRTGIIHRMRNHRRERTTGEIWNRSFFCLWACCSFALSLGLTAFLYVLSSPLGLAVFEEILYCQVNQGLYIFTSFVAQLVKNPPAIRKTWVRSRSWEDPLEKGKATHSSILAWRIPWIGEFQVHGVAKS